MKRYIKRLFIRTKNKIYFSWKREQVTTISKGIYAIALYGLYHEDNKISCDLLSGDIIIHIPKFNYHIVATRSNIIITNHEFPNLGEVGIIVVERFRKKAIIHISKLRQETKNEILNNNRNLIQEVRTKLFNSYKS